MADPQASVIRFAASDLLAGALASPTFFAPLCPASRRQLTMMVLERVHQ
jgi:hypothetical protein